MTSSGATWQPPPAFDEYELLEPLGRGSMGQVYLARDVQLDRRVAVKLLLSVSVDEAQRERFWTEARAVARVRHPNVVQIFRVGEVQRHPYLVSEYLVGASLERLPRPQPWQRVLRFGIALARGLAEVHRQGVLHRDLKPANAFLTEDDEVKLLDFGVAKLAGASAPPGHVAMAPAADPSSATTQDLPAIPPAPPARVQTPGAEDGPRWPDSASGLVGTPRYMAPELWAGEPATELSDLYSLGVLLFELLCGGGPYPVDSVASLPEAFLRAPVPLASAAPGVDPALARAIDRCVERDPRERFPSARALREELESLLRRARGAARPVERPYPGLHAFTVQERAQFFGRDAEAREVVERLRAGPLVVLAADSGAGKSSLCRAGVLPACAEGALGGRAPWAIAELVPGSRPLESLASALAAALSAQEAELLRELSQEPSAVARRALAATGAGGLLCFVDQLEELSTQAPPADAAAFARALGELAGGHPRLKVLATARGDFLGRLVALPGLGERLGGGLYLLPHLSGPALRDAITAPARDQGVRFESEALVDALAEAGEAEGALPLLQFALSQLWERRDRARNLIPARALEALGGVAGALARHADGVLEALRPAQRDCARALLVQLVHADGTRARRARSELVAASGATESRAAEVLEALVRGRLVVARESSGDADSTYELSHEALARGWHALRDWLFDSREQRAVRERLEAACAEWERLGRSADHLWKARQLAEAAALEGATLRPPEVAFLSASRLALLRRRLAGWAAVVLPVLTAAGAYAGFAFQTSAARERVIGEAMETARAALGGAAVRHGEVEAQRKEALGSFDAGLDFDRAEHAWSIARLGAAQERDGYDQAVRAFDQALFADPARAEVRRGLADGLYQYILLAERDRLLDARNLLQGRLEAVDDTRERARALQAPAEVTVSSDPPGAEMTLQQWVEAGQGPARWSEARALGTTPLETRLAPGSYRLVLKRPGGSPAVYFPVLLSHGERFHASIPLPLNVPAGYVYVPPGRFLYGSTDDDRRRSAEHLPPIHEASTDGFLIGRYEVTYAEWIEYLRALSPKERALRRPHGQNQFGTIELAQGQDGRWAFTMRPARVAAFAYVAREGEPVRYQDRDRNQVQDWRRFPVSGVSYGDGLAYMKWLDQTGRLRGARMCTAREWERAARGADAREYPEGDSVRPDDANIDETYGWKDRAFGPDEIGRHPASDSPFGVSDMSGNVGELLQGNGPDQVLYAVHSFYYDRVSARVFNHGPGANGLASPLIGLRVCAPVSQN